MKTSRLNIFFILTIVFALASCDTETVESISKNAGYIEYQYDYVLVKDSVSTAKKGYERANLPNAAFALYNTNDLPDSLTQAGLRKIELYLYSDNYDLSKSASEQELGSSMIQITLVDTLGNDTQTNRIWPATYSIQSTNVLLKNKKLQSLGMSVNMNLLKDTTADSLAYKYQFNAELTRSIRILPVGNNEFQLISYGQANSKIYNVYYIGTIKQLDNLISE